MDIVAARVVIGRRADVVTDDEMVVCKGDTDVIADAFAGGMEEARVGGVVKVVTADFDIKCQ